mmetsp:Transcript_12431/g.22458  ORF Transcript_12431/g.22458 Transcript_12431/m.22458 type:complete len:189 (-) Transcript_12431:400-966(-)|eukprot:CAMPEP_0182445390 /NCGR_PEP_ID=MMETSP1172-20130603/3529_1 /TAXON_ID=708627 /ORGANISM="Timspurckia oligopyrenoides, Strain CCMP3278" /LENGTH=188 /DNA_ID=CAMNT_0024641155 /DNA_START=283 /DNA_END=849 /DNA_ORIENTATION=+
MEEGSEVRKEWEDTLKLIFGSQLSEHPDALEPVRLVNIDELIKEQNEREAKLSFAKYTQLSLAIPHLPSEEPSLKKPVKMVSLSTSKSPYFCEACEIDVGSKSNWNSHQQGKSHLRKVAIKEGGLVEMAGSDMNGLYTRRGDLNTSGTNSNPLFCDVCRVFATDLRGMQQHRSGQKHRKALVRSLYIV